MSLGEYAPFIVSSYAVTALVLAGLIAWLIREGRRYERELARLEGAGLRRRSAEPAARAGHRTP